MKMSFGLQGAPATFQRMMDRLIQGLQGFASAFLDDLVIYSNSWEEKITFNTCERYCSSSTMLA